jgi:hypothetical protein
MIKKIIPAIILFVMIFSTGFSQEDYRNSVFLEIGGSAYFGSINYERTIKKDLNARIGIFYTPDILVIPLSVSKLFGESKHKFELATGITVARNPNADIDGVKKTGIVVLLTGFIGYRYQAISKRILFRAGVTPVLSVYDNFSKNNSLRFTPWAGISCGWRF